MSKTALTRTTNPNRFRTTSRSYLLPTAAVAFVSAVTGIGVGVVAVLSIAMPMVHQALAAEVSGANARLTSSVIPSESGCFETAVGGAAGAPVSSAAIAQNQPSQSSQSSSQSNSSTTTTNNTFIKNLIGGQFVNNVATIKNTGPESSNEVIAKSTSITKVTNTNDVQISATNTQNSASGSANVSNNTNGGAATSGQAENANTTSLSLTINNQ